VERSLRQYQNAENIAPRPILRRPLRSRGPSCGQTDGRSSCRRDGRSRLSTREFSRPSSSIRPAITRGRGNEPTGSNAGWRMGFLPGHRTLPQCPDPVSRRRRL
jgi:hypothetical protein